MFQVILLLLEASVINKCNPMPTVSVKECGKTSTTMHYVPKAAQLLTPTQSSIIAKTD